MRRVKARSTRPEDPEATPDVKKYDVPNGIEVANKMLDEAGFSEGDAQVEAFNQVGALRLVKRADHHLGHALRDVAIAEAPGADQRQSRAGYAVAADVARDRRGDDDDGVLLVDRDEFEPPAGDLHFTLAVALLLLKGLAHKEIAEVRSITEATARQQARAVARSPCCRRIMW